jgi:hypothetical protein
MLLKTVATVLLVDVEVDLKYSVILALLDCAFDAAVRASDAQLDRAVVVALR